MVGQGGVETLIPGTVVDGFGWDWSHVVHRRLRILRLIRLRGGPFSGRLRTRGDGQGERENTSQPLHHADGIGSREGGV